MIYRSTTEVRSIVSRLGPEHHDRLVDIGNCPTQFQQYITGVDCRYAGRAGQSIEARSRRLALQ